VPDSLKKSIFEHEKVGFDNDSIKQSLANCLTYSVGKDTITATDRDRFFSYRRDRGQKRMAAAIWLT